MKTFHGKRKWQINQWLRLLQSIDINNINHEMRDIATTYYHQLLSAKSFLEEDLNKRQLVLETVQQKVTHVMASQLLQPFTDTEVWTMAKSLGKYVCPGKDAIGVVFYLHYWDLLGPILTRAINLIFSTGNMPDEWTEGIIYMIPKSDAQCNEISKWCPITLLNDIYKIVAKTIANRMCPMLPSIIHDTQLGSVKAKVFLTISSFFGR